MRTLLALTTAALALPVGACAGGGDDDGADRPAAVKPPAREALDAIGEGEGELDLVAWAGYVEDGSNDPDVDWVSDFEQRTGCRVDVKVGATSEELVTLMRSGEYDGVSASGDATLRLIEAGDVAPVNTDLIKNYSDVVDGLKDKPWNSVAGTAYGVPQGRGANVLLWREDAVDDAPESWAAVFEPDSPHRGKVTAYDNPIYIADAALYLKAARPELGIEDVYALDDEQFRAAVELLEAQRSIVGRYWSDYAEARAAFAGGGAVIGPAWQAIAELLEDGDVDVGTTLPDEGATGWSNTWMIAAEAAHPNCMYMWMDHVISPRTNAAMAQWFGEAPSNAKACAHTTDEDHCDTFHAEDEGYFDDVAYWTTPRKECGDDRGAVCTDYGEWARAWRAIGAR
jgi:putative spermidine/putrescine transport system substrate-binding protein